MSMNSMPWIPYAIYKGDRIVGLKKETPQWIRDAYEEYMRSDEPDENGKITNL